jgi:hypothetical protein
MRILRIGVDDQVKLPVSEKIDLDDPVKFPFSEKIDADDPVKFSFSEKIDGTTRSSPRSPRRSTWTTRPSSFHRE